MMSLIPTPWIWGQQDEAAAPLSSSKSLSRSDSELDPATLEALNADAWPVREATTLKLLRDQTLTPQQIARAFERPLSAEQRLRLMLVAEHHVIRLLARKLVPLPTTASLGVALEWLVPEEVAELGRPAVRVEATLPGFPAYGLLQVGDLIVALDGQGIDASVMGPAMVEVMRDRIQIRQAGETAELLILRDGRLQTVHVQLGSLEAMRALYEPDTLTLQPVAAQEWRQYQASLPRR